MPTAARPLSISAMTRDEIVADFIAVWRPRAQAEHEPFERLPLEQAVHHAALFHRAPGNTKRWDHSRASKQQLEAVERRLQSVRDGLALATDFEFLHKFVDREIGWMPGIRDLAVYDIAERIGASLGIEPRLVYLHRGTAEGARHLGFRGATLDPSLLPEPFSQLTPREIEDCLCIYKDYLRPGGDGFRHSPRPCLPEAEPRGRNSCASRRSVKPAFCGRRLTGNGGTRASL